MREGTSQADHRWPEPAMYVGDLAAYQPTHENVARLPNATGQTEYRVAFRMSPPTAAYRLPRDSLRHVWYGPTGAFQDNAVATDKSERSFRGHYDKVSDIWVQSNDPRFTRGRLGCGRRGIQTCSGERGRANERLP